MSLILAPQTSIRSSLASAVAAAAAGMSGRVPSSALAPYVAMARDLLRRMWAVPSWRALIAFYSSIGLLATLVKIQRRGADRREKIAKKARRTAAEKKKKDGAGGGDAGGKQLSHHEHFWKLTRLAIPGVLSPEFGHLVAYGSLLLFRVRMGAKIIEIGTTGMKYMSSKQWDKVLMMLLVLLLVPLLVLTRSCCWATRCSASKRGSWGCRYLWPSPTP